mmetsp:Transcript_16326/g.44981  ORF Transcript_16326/g.44981 Transcript_16326/m.44981 type:complete len:277 (-) Transcript_16326:140-970(-)
MPRSAQPCASLWGKWKASVSEGTSTVPPPTPRRPETRPVPAPSPNSGASAAASLAPGTARRGMRPAALTPMTVLTMINHPPNMRFSSLGLTLPVSVAPTRAVTSAATAMAAAARTEARPRAKYARQAMQLTARTTHALVPMERRGSVPRSEVSAGTTRKPPPRPKAPPRPPATAPMPAAPNARPLPVLRWCAPSPSGADGPAAAASAVARNAAVLRDGGLRRDASPGPVAHVGLGPTRGWGRVLAAGSGFLPDRPLYAFRPTVADCFASSESGATP